MPTSALPEVDDAVLDDLRSRLRAFRPVPVAAGHGWDRGVDQDYLASLLAHWVDGYDWRRHERRLRALPWVEVAHDRTPVRLVHQRAADDAPTVVLLHGWPDSVLRFERVLPLLGDLDVVVPALPGFPFAAPVAEGGLPTAAMAEASPGPGRARPPALRGLGRGRRQRRRRGARDPARSRSRRCT